MIRFKAFNEETKREILGLGMTSEDVAVLAQGSPLIIPMEQVGFENSKVDVVLLYGRTLEDLGKIHGVPVPQVQEAGEDELRKLRGEAPSGTDNLFST